MQLKLEQCGIGPQTGVLVALSGGADSVALLQLMKQALLDGRIRSLVAAHLNHGIRGSEADRDETFCMSLCGEMDVPLYHERVDVPAYAAKTGESLETAARHVRYDFLNRILKARGLDVIATAHHMDDQAETVLMHLIRGSGTDGLAGIRSRSGNIVRPLLHVRHGELCAFLSGMNMSWCEDASNSVPDAFRNRIRLQLLPLLEEFNPGIATALSRTASYADADASYLNEIAAGVLKTASMDGGWLRETVSAQPPAIRVRCIKQILEGIGFPDGFSHNDIHRMEEILHAQSSTMVPLHAGFVAFADGKLFRVFRQEMAEAFSELFERSGSTVFPGGCFRTERRAFHLPEDPFEAYVDMDCIPRDAVVRTRRQADRFHPLGAPGNRNLSDVMTDRKIPPSERNVPLLCSGNVVLWMPGYTVSEQVKVTSRTSRVLYIRYECQRGK